MCMKMRLSSNWFWVSLLFLYATTTHAAFVVIDGSMSARAGLATDNSIFNPNGLKFQVLAENDDDENSFAKGLLDISNNSLKFISRLGAYPIDAHTGTRAIIEISLRFSVTEKATYLSNFTGFGLVQMSLSMFPGGPFCVLDCDTVDSFPITFLPDRIYYLSVISDVMPGFNASPAGVEINVLSTSITPVPVLPSFWLFVFGLFGLVVQQSRK